MSHPLQAMSVDVRSIVTCGCSELDERFDGKNVLLVGMISSVRTINTKKGDQMAFIQLEDMGGQGEVVVFPRTYAEVKEMLIPDSIVMVKGKAQAREGQTSLLADSFQNYVDQIISVGPDPQYQKPLLDMMPTINGFHTEESRMSDDTEATSPYSASSFDLGGGISFGSDDDDSSMMEESPFANEPPAWLRTETTGAASPAKPAAKTAPSPTVATPAAGKEEAARDNPYLHESRNLREEDSDIDIPLPKHLQGDSSLLAELETPQEPSSAKETEEAAPANPYLHESRNLREEDDDSDIPLPKTLQANGAQFTDGTPKPTPQPAAMNDAMDGALDDAQAQAEKNGSATNNAHANGHHNGQNGTNGHSNSQANSRSKKNSEAKGASSLAANGKRTMQILFRPTGDIDRDKYRLKQIVDTVRDPKGRDQFVIMIKGGGKTTTLAFPDDPCSISDRLRNDLHKFFRVDVNVKE